MLKLLWSAQSTSADGAVANGANGVASTDAPEAEAAAAVEGDAEKPAAEVAVELKVEAKEDGEAVRLGCWWYFD